MSPQTDERRPRQDAAPIPTSQQKIETQSTRSTSSLAEVERRADLTGYVVRAVTTLANGTVRVQHYASLHAAVRAAERAEARGCACVLGLCRVVPVERVDLDVEAVLR